MKMKKGLLMLGVAVAAFSSCTNEEVVDMPANRAINFNGFVNNNTRAVTEVTKDNLAKFYVFGKARTSASSAWNVDLFDNAEVNGGQSIWNPVTPAYWEVGKDHRFAAYSDGNVKNNDVTYSVADQKLTFANYTPVNTKDLIVAIPAQIDGTSVTDGYNTKVDLSFYHMLSQVKFTFTTKVSDTYTLKISDIQVATATTSATGTYTIGTTGQVGTIDWTTSPTSGTIDFDEIANIITGTNSTANLVIPQENTNNIKVTFTADLYNSANEHIGTADFTAPLSYEATSTSSTVGTDNTWTPGYRYNYTAEIPTDKWTDPDDPDKELMPIEFTVSAVDGWENANESTATVSVVEP